MLETGALIGLRRCSFGKAERASIDYIENKRTPPSKDWAHGFMPHKKLKNIQDILDKTSN
jgi:hypothetical protein